MSTYTDASLIYYPSGYKAGKAYSLKPTDGSGDLTFTRASTATRVNESGLIESVATGVPRIDFTGGGCGKLLLEPQRTNVSDNSENFSDWIQVGFTQTLNSTISPSNTLTADTFFESAGTTHIAFKDFSVTSGLNYTISFFLKSQGGRNVRILGSTGFSGSVDVNLSTGAILAGSGIVETFINGWYRVSINCNATTSTGRIILYSLDGTSSVEGDPTKGIICWGAQVEQGSYPTSYIPTTTTAVTMVGDACLTTNLQSSSIIGATQGTFFLNTTKTTASTWINQRIFETGTTTRSFLLDNSGGQIRLRVWDASSVGPTITTSGLVEGFVKYLIKWDGTNVKVFANGVLQGSSAAPSYAYNTYSAYESTAYSNNAINQFLFFPTALSDAECIALTTL